MQAMAWMAWLIDMAWYVLPVALLLIGVGGLAALIAIWRGR